MSRARGLSLVELLVAMTLGALALGIIVYLVMAALKVSFRGTARVELQQSAATVARTLSADLARTPIFGVTVLEQPSRTTLSVHPLSDVGTDGAQRWSSQLLLYHWEEGRVVRLEVPSGSTDRARRPNPADVTAWLGDSSLPRRTLAREVEVFALRSAAPGPVLEQPLTLVLELSRPAAGAQGAERYQLEQDLYLMNSSL